MMQTPHHSQIERCGDDIQCGKCHNNIVDPRGFVLMTTPKVGTQSIYHAHRQNAGGFSMFRSKQFVIDHCKQMFVVGFVRNPFDRLVSAWYDKCILKHHRTNELYGLRAGMPFETFARTVCEVPHHQADKHWRLMSYDLYTEAGRPLPHVLVRFENMATDWRAAIYRIEKVTRVRLPELEHRHASGKPPWQDQYTPELVERVGDHYHDDLLNFGYSFDDQAHLPIDAAAV